MQTCETRTGKILLALLLCGSVISIAAVQYSDNELPKFMEYRLRRNTIPRHYNIDLTLSAKPFAAIVNGESVIKLRLRQHTRIITLHYVGNITAAKLHYSYDLYHKPSVSVQKETGTVELRFRETLLIGLYHLHLKYFSYPREGIFKTSQFVEKLNTHDWFMTTTFQPIGARYLFPCWDEPGLKTTFQISVKHPQQYMAYSNMQIKSGVLKDDFIVTRFMKTPEMSIYHLAIVIVPKNMTSAIVNLEGVVYISRISLEREYMYQISQRIMNAMSSYIEFKLKHKLDQIIIPSMPMDNVANWGLTVYKESAITYDKKLDPIARKLEIKRLLARSYTYAFFGYAVSPIWWTYLWIQEGFAIFCQSKLERLDWRMKEMFVVQTRYESLQMDVNLNMMALQTRQAFDDPLTFLFSINFKAPIILYMVENIVSPEIFRNAIIRYLKEHMFQHATSDDLWTEMETLLDETNVEHAYVLKDVMHSWVKHQNYPTVEVTRNNENEISICLQRFSKSKRPLVNETWWIPITYTLRNLLNFDNTLPQAWITPDNLCVTLDPIRTSDWIMVNMQQAGYYRVKYEQWNWQLIAEYLNSVEYKRIHVLNRAQIIDDAYYFMKTGQLDYNIFLNLTNYLSQETDYVAWYPMLKNLEDLSRYLPFDETGTLKAHILKILNAVLEKIKYEEHENDDDYTKSLRQEIAKWACILHDSNCMKIANAKLSKHLDDLEKNNLLPDWKTWTYCNGLTEANRVTWLKFWSVNAKLLKTNTFHIFSCSESASPHFRINLPTGLMAQYRKCTNILYHIVMAYDTENSIDDILSSLKNHIFYCKYNLSNLIKIVIAMIHHLYTDQQLWKIDQFAKETLKETSLDIRNMVKVRRSNIKRHMKMFSAFTKAIKTTN